MAYHTDLEERIANGCLQVALVAAFIIGLLGVFGAYSLIQLVVV